MRKSILALAIGGILALPVAAAAPASADTVIRTVPSERVVIVKKKKPRVVRHVYVDRYGNRHVTVRERAPRRVIVRERPVYVAPY